MVDCDAYYAGPFPTKRAAVDWCRRTALDYRKRPVVRRLSLLLPGLYYYRGPHLGPDASPDYYEIANDRMLMLNGYPTGTPENLINHQGSEAPREKRDA